MRTFNCVIQVMSKLPVPNDDHVLRYARLAGLLQSRSIANVNVGPSTPDSGIDAGGRGRAPRRSSTPLELDACCRSNIVTARTRFFEEKSRSASPATPPQRRSRSATRNDDQHPRWNLGRGGSPSTPRAARHLPASRSVQTAVHRHGQPASVSMPVSKSTQRVNNLGVNNETDELKV